MGLLLGEKIHSAERSNYLKEIDALRVTVTRLEQLEAENGELKAGLQEARQRHRECSSVDENGGSDAATRSNATIEADALIENQAVDIEEYNRVKEDLVQLERDYGKLAWARDHLEAKVREQKDSLRQWKEYRKNWILKHPNKRLSHLRPSSTIPSSVTTAHDRRYSSAPAPPALPEGFTPSPSGVSRSTSPHRNAPTESNNDKSRGEQAIKFQTTDRGSQLREAKVSQADQNTAGALGSDDITDATPESEGQAEPVKTEPAPGSSSPIVIFERSLKRRHSTKVSVQNIHVHVDDRRCSGAAPGIHTPKEEQVSSPTEARPLTNVNGTYDSLDLDDVGGHLDTPRKRQRMAQERLKSSRMLPLTAAQWEDDMPYDMITDPSNQTSNEYPPAIEGERDKEAYLSTDECKTLPRAAEEEKRARRDERMARQHAHNDRVHQRLESTEKTNPILDPPRSSSPTTDESAQQPRTPNDPREIIRQRKAYLGSPVIIQPRDLNASDLPRTSDPFASRKRPCPPSRRDRGPAHVPVVAEDGEGLAPDGDALKAGKKAKDDPNNSHDPSDKEPRAPSRHHRLEALLTKPSPEKSLLIPEEPVLAVFPDQAWSKTPIPRSVYHSRSKGPATPRSLPAKKSGLKHSPENKGAMIDIDSINGVMDKYSKSAQAVTKRTKDVPTAHKASPLNHHATRPQHEPLRARPVHRLGLQDFKLNPAYSDYAYHESVRKHDEKKALSGCTDRHCPRCKGLRRHVVDSGYKTALKPGESEDEADDRLLRHHLGDNHGRLKNLSGEEREEIFFY